MGEDGKKRRADKLSKEVPTPFPKRQNPMVRGAVLDGRYRVERGLGRGGMGVVLLARDLHFDRHVALKLVSPDLVSRPEALTKFHTEARAMAGIRHVNVVNVFAYGDHEGQPYFVMEYVPGTTVIDILLELEKNARVPHPDEVVGILEQVCRGLTAIHEAGVIHGDIKPGNVLIGPAFRAVVTDFGLMRWTGQPENLEVVTGTPAYIPPEVVLVDDLELRLTPAADVYALAVMAFEMFTGRLPFAIDSVQELFDVHRAHLRAPKLSDVRADLPTTFDAVIARALSPDLDDRYATADAFRRALVAARSAAAKPDSAVRIVLADDDEDFRDIANVTLAHAFPGAEIVCVEDGNAALDAIDRMAPHLAVVDLRMPGLNGVELTAAVRATARGRNVPIVVVTAHGGAPDWGLLQSLGASGFLVKPIDPYALVALARRVIRVS
jgi:serine/threonine protein kinase